MFRSEEGTDRTFEAALLAGLPDPVIAIDAQAAVVHANPAAERVLGWRAADYVGASVIELVHPDDRQLAALSLTSIESKEVGTAIEVRVATHDGGWRHLEVIGTNLLDDPAVRAVVLVARDLTERHRWEVAGGDDVGFRLVVQHSAAVTMLLRPDGRIASASAALTRLLGHDPEQVAGQHLSALVADADRDLINRRLEDAAGASEPTLVEASFPAAQGGEVALGLTIVNLLSDPAVAGFVVTAHDIRDRKAAEAAVADSQRQLAEAQRLAGLGSWEWDIATDTITWSPQLIDLFDLDEASYPRDYERYLATLHPDDVDTVDAIVRAAFESHEPFEVDHRVIARDGSVRWLHGRGTVVIDGTVPVRMIGTCIDVTERLRLQEELQALALIDPLTGLRNRRGFLLTADQELSLARRLGMSAALMYADVDNLKTINDTHGHQEGDQALCEAARLITATFRESDIKARLSGDEFAVFLIDTDSASAQRAAERLRESLELRNHQQDRRYELTLSIGLVVTDGATSVEAMLAEADEAMYADKRRLRRRPRLLLVEDDPRLRRLLGLHLSETFDVTTAEDLSHALQAMSVHPPDIVLLDRNLPDHRGADALQRIRAVAGDAHLVVMTGEGAEAEAESLRSGAADFITKPFDLKVLDARLTRLLERPTRGHR